MLDFLQQHQMYIVMGVLLLIWAGIVWYLFRLDGKVKKLEEVVKKG